MAKCGLHMEYERKKRFDKCLSMVDINNSGGLRLSIIQSVIDIKMINFILYFG